jgi:acetyl-CoA C-acetyltransferase
VITSGVRIAIGDFGGANMIDQLVFGNVIHTEPHDMYLSRVAAMGAGVPATSPALTLNRLCGSGLQAVVTGAEQIMLGNAEVVLAGGAENIATINSIDRAAQDALAMESHRRAGAAINDGRVNEQILLLMMVKKGRQQVVFERDEHVRANISNVDLQKLPTFFKEKGTVTAGNASGINDAAAAITLAAEQTADALGLPKLAFIRASTVCGVAPEVMGMGPVPAVRLACIRAGLSLSDMSYMNPMKRLRLKPVQYPMS